MGEVVLKGSVDTINSLKTKGLMSTQIFIKDLLSLYKLDLEVNRDLSYNRLPDLIKYYAKFQSEAGIFLPALVFSFRENPNYDVDKNALILNNSSRLVVIDGQHRIKAMEKYIERIKDETQKQEFLNSVITSQIYLGLNKEDERKLFSDINSNAKKVSMSLITQYDSRDVMNLLVQELHRLSTPLKTAGIELNKSKVIRPANKAFSTGMRLKFFISYLLFGKKKISPRDEKILKLQYDEIVSFLNKFFSILFSTLPSTPGDVLKYILGHETTQNAIALYLNESLMIEDTEMLGWIDDWETEVEQLAIIDWSVKNIDWNKWTIINNNSEKKISYKGLIESATPEIVTYIKSKIN
ncbi:MULTISPECIES: DNA sulfur modification protein DndB [Paenibacillus]|uniref:DNA sulfur modification protein DndB n=1 Tax=Paenibacillus TaxID=44249 RepID=UPI00096E2592|nr:DNA sulfur modification protein DndB [Paenibacillus odorifer]OMD80419.1 hypothetical protein BSK53_20385 [Paenibacillus odorifer]